MPSVDISIVIPAYNEEKIILSAIESIQAYACLKRWDWEIIVSSDGSDDETNSIVRKAIEVRGDDRLKLFARDKNRGKGDSVRRAVLSSKGNIILITDADLSSPIKEADKLINKIIEGADIAIGSRAIRKPGCDVRQTLKRRISGRVFNFFVQRLVLSGIYDTQCGFKCFKSGVAKEVFGAQRLDGFSFDVEVLYLARKRGYKIDEVSVMWSQGEDSKVRFFRDSFLMLRDITKIKKIHG